MVTVAQSGYAVMREPLAAPFGFKGGYVDELWQSIVTLQDSDGNRGTGLGVQSILWSDPGLFARWGHERGNTFMHEITVQALKAAVGMSFDTPPQLFDALLEEASDFTRARSEMELRHTFLLNALVPIDQAAWHLAYLKSKNLNSQLNGVNGLSFKELLPTEFQPILSAKHERVACAPVVSYGMSNEDILALVEEGYFVLKIKLGSDPDGDGDEEKMLEWDIGRMNRIHQLVREYETRFTDHGGIAYYLDINGRYRTTDQLLRLADAADRSGALSRILVVEEPYHEDVQHEVWDVPFRIAGDESVHSVEDALERIQMGYGAFALKPVAKTMSLSLRVAQLAANYGIPCFCADLTASPIMVDWNKCLAAHLPPVPGLATGLIESNGPQNYLGWKRMQGYHPMRGEEWIESSRGFYRLPDSFYSSIGGVFGKSSHYESLIQL
ncbi:enolase C-terminal domain-like protein [Paenibacillus sp. strain BS8-2]